ncbi:MAG: hypothetical protein N4A68_03545 [Maledivibacter sp.]|jgi:hypothetical protein|nr:hypothetical protein [Maledivibacter sp.]
MSKITIQGKAPDIEKVINLIESKYDTESKDNSKLHKGNVEEVVLLITPKDEEKSSEVFLPKMKIPLRSKKFTCKKSEDLKKIVGSLDFLSREEKKYNSIKKFLKD